MRSPAGHGAVLCLRPHTDAVVPGDTCIHAGRLGDHRGSLLHAAATTRPPYAARSSSPTTRRDCIWVMLRAPTACPTRRPARAVRRRRADPVDLEIGPGGDLFYVDFDGGTISASVLQRQPAPSRMRPRPASGPVPLNVRFDGSGSCDPDGDALSYAWDLDADGAVRRRYDGRRQSPVHRCGQRHGSAARARPGGPRGDRYGRRHPGNTPPQPAISAPIATRAGASAT